MNEIASPKTAWVDGAESAGDRLVGRQNVGQQSKGRSRLFRWGDTACAGVGHLFGIVSVIFILAVTASIPIVQFLSYGYLLEVTGRLARGGKLRDAMVGLKKARVVGGVVLGIWLCLLPIRLLSNFWFEAYLIDPGSRQTSGFRIALMVFIVLTISHIVAALVCGGKLRYFFWPLILPVSLAVWAVRRMAGFPLFKKILRLGVGWIAPSLPDDICNVQPISDWFLPMIVWKKIRHGGLYIELRERVWDFFAALNLGYYFKLGAFGFIGTFLWLLVPTGCLVVSTKSTGAIALITFLFGVAIGIPVFSGLPFLQAHFAADGKLKRFMEWRIVFGKFGMSPLVHVVALLMMLVLALPLFFLKIETIPSELLWTLSLVFVVFSWPARIAVGLAYRRAHLRQQVGKQLSRWWWRYAFVLLAAPISFVFVLIFTSTRYVSWNGARSLFENHVFLLPAPFWM